MTNTGLPRTAGVPTLKRLPLYLRYMRELKTQGCEYASGAVVARDLCLDPIVVRKDLAITGVVGKPRMGFPVNELIEAIQLFLGWSNTTDAFLVGAGHMGKALLGYQGFRQYGLSIVAGFDSDPALIGTNIHGKNILDVNEMPILARRMHVQLGILTVSAEAAQDVAEMMVAAGFRGIWNFTPVRLDVPSHVILQREDLASSLAVLSHKLYVNQK